MPSLKKNVRDEESSAISYDEALTVLQSMLTKCSTVEALQRFHPTRPLTEQMQGRNRGISASVLAAEREWPSAVHGYE